jgi:DnaK suppressor protein
VALLVVYSPYPVYRAPGLAGRFLIRVLSKAVEMEAQTLSQLRAHLEEELSRLEAEVAEIESQERSSLSEASGENAYRDHMADQGSAAFEQLLDMTLEENLRVLLADVRSALARIDAGVYGLCERCSAEIPEERMEAVPTASLCIKCKEADEHR